MKYSTYKAFLSLTLVLLSMEAFAGHHKKMTGGNIVEVAASTGQFNTLIAAAKAAGLAGALTGEGPLTVFAPTDEAFAKLPEGTVASLLKPENKDQLAAILSYHVAAGKLKASDVIGRSSVETIGGLSPRITVDGSTVMIDNAKIIKVDVSASNGVIHVIDSVILPPEKQAMNISDLIELAVAKGAPMYNHGQKRACADLYEVTVVSMLAMGDQLEHAVHTKLSEALNDARLTHRVDKRAWILREAMDSVYYNEMPEKLAAR